MDIARIVNEKDYATEVLSDIKRHSNNNGLNVLIDNAAIQIFGGVEIWIDVIG